MRQEFKKIPGKMLADFKIGFEFEVFVNNADFYQHIEDQQKEKNQQNYIEDKKYAKAIPKEIKEKYGHLFSVKKSNNLPKKYNTNKDIPFENIKKFIITELNKKYPQYNWNQSFLLKGESSLDNLDKKTAVEIVFKHEDGKTAYEKLWCIMELLSTPVFYINSDCGLHINISFKNEIKNLKNLAISASDKINISKIKKDFGRTNNDFCIDNQKTSSYEIQDDIGDFVSKHLIPSQCSLLNVRNKLVQLKKPEHMKKFVALMEQWCEERFISSWEDERPAIAPKNMNGKNYLEFRATGGKNYSKKTKQINDAILAYLQGMKLAYQIELKKAKPKFKIN